VLRLTCVVEPPASALGRALRRRKRAFKLIPQRVSAFYRRYQLPPQNGTFFVLNVSGCGILPHCSQLANLPDAASELNRIFSALLLVRTSNCLNKSL
jgi:hypothetical protein